MNKFYLLSGLLLALVGCAEHDEACLEWHTEACEAYHRCGMMQGVSECGEHAAYTCSDETPSLEGGPGCEEVSASDVAPCTEYIRRTCPTFEDLTEVPQCAALMRCLGWPM